MEYKQLSKEFRELFFKLNSVKNMPEEESVKMAFYGIQQASEEYNLKIEENSKNYSSGSEILFIKANREMVTTKTGNRFFKVKSYSYKTARIVEMDIEKIKLSFDDLTYKFNYKTVFEVGCWRK